MSPAHADAARPRKPRGSWIAIVVSFAVVVAAVTGVLARGPQTAEKLVYAYSFEPGQSRVYSMSMRMLLTPQGVPDFTDRIDLNMTAKMTMKVIEVRKDDSTLIDLRVSDAKFSETTGFLGPADQAIPDESMRLLISRSGEVLSVDGSGVFGGAFDPTEFLGVPGGDTGGALGSSSFFPTFPSEAIGPGDAWSESQDIPLPFGGEKVHVTAKGEHQGFESSNYGRVARVNVKMTMPVDFSFSFADILEMSGEQAAGQQLPPGFESVRMIMDGKILGDMTALVLPDGSDLTKMQADMKMDFSMRLENATPELTQGSPTSFSMLGDTRIKLDRIE